uniref:Uncharacterized protein n=1 Tax=Ditylenchus dipsaci TaxID=166011 RepID=A0A915DTW2_9BILA
MNDAAYEPIGGIGEGEPSPMLFAPPPPAPPPKTKGESYVPPPPPSPGYEISKQSQLESNIGARFPIFLQN